MKRRAISPALRAAVIARDGSRCSFCQLRQLGQGATFHIDHLYPFALGGPTKLDNLALQCPSCNGHKSSQVEANDPITGERVPLFQPLRQQWGDHFTLHANGSIVGRTATGRATIVALQMNKEQLQIARAIQIEHGLLPVDDE